MYIRRTTLVLGLSAISAGTSGYGKEGQQQGQNRNVTLSFVTYQYLYDKKDFQEDNQKKLTRSIRTQTCSIDFDSLL